MKIKNLDFFIGVLFVCLGFLHAYYYYPFLSDDALISLRYARRFVLGLGLTYTDNEWVEGYSNFLWVLSSAALHALGLDLVLAARMLGLGSLMLSIYGLTQALDGRKRIYALALFVSSAPIAVWSIGCLEQLASCAFVILSINRLKASAPIASIGGQLLKGPGIYLAILTLLRADGAIFTIALTAYLLLKRGSHLVARLFGVIALPFSAYVLQFFFRLFYYHEILPNTAYAKVAFNLARVISGLHYVYTGIISALVVFGLAAVALVFAAWLHKEKQRDLLGETMAIVFWLFYVVIVGGDIFPAYRQIVPVFGALTVLAAHGLEIFLAKVNRSYGQGAIFFLLIGVNLCWQTRDRENVRGISERWEWAGYPLGPVLKENFAEKDALLAIDAAGALPYWSELNTLDMLGLNDHYIAKHPPQGFGYGQIGHELGNGAYIFERKPDIIMFCGARGAIKPCFIGGKELIAMPEFAASYQLVQFWGLEPFPSLGLAYMKREDSKVGIERSIELVKIPAYFFSFHKANAAKPNTDGKLCVHLADRAQLQGVRLAKGKWEISSDGDYPSLRIALSSENFRALPAQFDLLEDGFFDFIGIDVGPENSSVFCSLLLKKL